MVNARTLLEVLLKFWGVLLLTSTLTSIPTPFYAELTRAQTISIALRLVISALVAVCLLLFAGPVSRLLMPGADAARLECPTGSLLEVALVALGVYLMVNGLKLAAVVGVELLRAQTWVKAGLQESVWANQRFNFVSGVTELLAGYLVLRFRRRFPQWLPGGS